MRETATPALPRRTKRPTAAPVPARRRPCVTYVSTFPGHNAAGPQQLLDDYAAAHGLDILARFVNHGSEEPGATHGLRNALDAIGGGQADVLLVMTLSAPAGERDAVCAEVASVRGTVVFVGWRTSASSDGSASPRAARLLPGEPSGEAPRHQTHLRPDSRRPTDNERERRVTRPCTR